MSSFEEEDVDWFEVSPAIFSHRRLHVRARACWDAEILGEVVPQQKIQVSAVQKSKGWLRLTAVEMWISYSRKTEGYVPLEDEGYPTLVPTSPPGGDWDQWAALLSWWPLGGLPPFVPATPGGAYLCHWHATETGMTSVKASWLRGGEELQFVGPANKTQASQLCQWLMKEMALTSDFEVILVQDQLALDGCARLLDHTDMKTVSRPFCAMTFARPRLLAAEETSLAAMAREEHWQLRNAEDHRLLKSSGFNISISSVYDAQVSQRVLAFFEELSQKVAMGVVVAMIPGHVNLKQACAEALALTTEARTRSRVLRGCDDQVLDLSVQKILNSFGRCYTFQLLDAYGPSLYLAQDLGALGHPVLGILLSRNNEGTSPESEEEMPPALALGLRVTLQGLSGEVMYSINASRSWTVGQLKEALRIHENHIRLMSSPSSITTLGDEELLESFMEEDATELTLHVLSMEPKFAQALHDLREDAVSTWQSLDEDLKSDRSLTLLAVTQEPSLLAESHFLWDAEVVLAAAGKDSSVLPLASHELWNDDEFVEAAIALDAKKAIQLALDSRLDELKMDHAMAAVRQNGLVVELLPRPMQSPELLEAAMQQDVCALQFAPEAMKDDRQLLERLLQRDGRALRYASRRLRGDRSLVLLAIATCPRVVLCASEEMLKDKEVLSLAMDQDQCLAQQLAHYASRI